MSGRYILTFLPFSKSYDEHPYWLIEKLEFIEEVINKAIEQLNKHIQEGNQTIDDRVDQRWIRKFEQHL